MTAPTPAPGTRETITAFEAFGTVAFTTTRTDGDYALGDGAEPLAAGLEMWHKLLRDLAPEAVRLASARQVHGTRILEHGDSWTGWQRAEGADGHLTLGRGTALAVTIADCVPVFLAHPDGATALLHSGWRGTAAGILRRALERVTVLGRPAGEWHLHLGPAICGRCYEVSPDVFEQLTGWQTIRHRHVDLRALLAEQAKESGVKHVTASPWCTKCDNDRFFSHRAGDAGRQIGVLVAPR